jgi:hypothetical protein
MIKDLTTSDVSRQNILNNNFALEKVELYLALGGITWKNERVFTKAQISNILQIDERTIDRYIENHKDEITQNGYTILKGLELKKFKEYVGDIHVVDISRAPSLGVFTFKTVLNIAMLITESQRAKEIRSKILDIVIDVVAQKSGGHTKYINQREDNYLPASYQEYSYRQQFTNALDNYLNMGKWKYGVYTNKIYQIIFLENATEYKKILALKTKDALRDTLYSEVLNLISSFEHGIAEDMKNESEKLGRKLEPKELDKLMKKVSCNPYLKPAIEDARVKMASRDLCFRDALHDKLENYIQSVPQSDFDKFLGETSKSLEERLSDPETLNVLKRLKDR